MGDILSTKLWTKSNNGNSLLCNFLPTVSQKIRHYLWSCLFHSCFYLLDKCRFLVFPFIALLPEPASPASSGRKEKLPIWDLPCWCKNESQSCLSIFVFLNVIILSFFLQRQALQMALCCVTLALTIPLQLNSDFNLTWHTCKFCCQHPTRFTALHLIQLCAMRSVEINKTKNS